MISSWRKSIVLLFCAIPASPATYHVAINGDDGNAGTTAEQPWKTLERVNSFRFLPGDRILLKGGETFKGVIRLSREDSGNDSAPLELGTFGDGRASILARKETGVSVTDVENLLIRNLVVTGDGASTNQGYGVHVENTLTNRLLKGLIIDSVEVSGFGQQGIKVTGKTYGYENVLLWRCSASQNLRGGLEVGGKLSWDSKMYAHKNVIISQCRAFDNPGDPTYARSHSGSGLVLFQVDGGRIEKSSAWNNGELCPAPLGGPVGIWTCASRRVVIEYCESFANRTKVLDGGGFDIDGGSEECVLQYNYSHDNEGPGLMVYSYPYSVRQDRGNVVRFNISVNDAAESERYAGLWIRTDENRIQGLEVYNNTVVTKGQHAAFVHADNVELTLRNNIFVSGPQGVPLRVDGAKNISTLKIHNNLYWRDGAPFRLRFLNEEINSLEQLASTLGTKLLENQNVGISLDPKIALAATSNTNPLPNLRGLVQFKPRIQLPANPGMFAAVHQNEVTRDFLGNELGPNMQIPFGAIGGP